MDEEDLDTTTATDFTTGYVEGFSGLPSVATTNNGADVGVTWIDDAAGKVVYAVSMNNGGTFGAPGTLLAADGADNNGYPQAAALGSRIVFSWTSPDLAQLAVYDTSTDSLGPIRTIADCTSTINGQAYTGCEGANVALDGTSTIGVSLSLCFGATSFPCNWLQNKDRESLVYFKSTNNGSSWEAPVNVQVPASAQATYINDFASSVFVGGKVYVYWNGWNALYADYHVYLKVGT